MTSENPKRRSKVQVKFRLPTATHQQLTAIADAQGLSLSKIIERAARQYIDEAKGNAPACTTR